MRLLLRIVPGVVVLAAAVVLLAPATLLDAALATRTGDRLRLVDAHGVWWRGRAVVASRDGDLRLPLAWHVALVPLVTGSLVAALQPEDGTAVPTGTVALHKDGVDVRDLHVVAPAALVPALVPALSGVALHGELDLHAPAFAWHADRALGTFDATWQDARIVAGAPIDLGRVTVEAKPDADGVAGNVRNSGGDLAIDGSLATHGNITSVSLKLAATAHAPQSVRAMLSLLGPADETGAVTLSWRSDRR